MSTEDANSSPWTMLSSEVKLESTRFSECEDIVSFPGAAKWPYYNIRVKAHGVCVAPIDQDDCVTLVGQYRYVLDRYTWELPAAVCWSDRIHWKPPGTN